MFTHLKESFLILRSLCPLGSCIRPVGLRPSQHYLNWASGLILFAVERCVYKVSFMFKEEI